MPLFSPHTSHLLLCSPFSLGDFHFFNSISFTQETIPLSLANLQQNHAKLFYANDLQHRNICHISMCKHDLVMQKLTSEKLARSSSSLWYLTLCGRATPKAHKCWSEITHLYTDRTPRLPAFFSGICSMLLLFLQLSQANISMEWGQCLSSSKSF